jgi:acetoin:2,6-dichlorophenolindophenol oxidoreductase subunit alpha
MTTATQERSPTLGHISNISERFSREWSLAMFRKTCVNHYFELETAKAFDAKLMKMPIYLSLGTEHVPAAIAAVSNDFQIFAQHRGHSYYLSFGGDRIRLIDELLHRPTGCAGGMGGSASIHDPSIRMFGHSGLMGDQIPIAVGAALGSGRPTLAVMGDASAEEDYVYGALGYAITKKVPLLAICEDNDLSILTRVATRRNWSIDGMARGLGMPAVDITDDPWLIAHYVKQYRNNLPALINIRVCRHRWHAGTGTDGPPEWNRFELIKQELKRLGWEKDASGIEEDASQKVRAEWEQQLAKPSNP